MRRASVASVARFAALGLVLAIAVAIVGFHSHAHSHGDLVLRDSSGKSVTVAEWKLGDRPSKVPEVLTAGNLEFWLENTDRVAHDFYVLRTQQDAGSLPVKDGTVDLSRLGEVVASVQVFEPGQQGAMSFSMPPGKYVLFCNQAGHYEHGMYYSFEVQ